MKKGGFWVKKLSDDGEKEGGKTGCDCINLW